MFALTVEQQVPIPMGLEFGARRREMSEQVVKALMRELLEVEEEMNAR